MKREEVLALLKDLMISCETLKLSPVVSLETRNGKWKLKVKWVDSEDKGCFDELIRQKGFKATETDDGFTIFA